MPSVLKSRHQILNNSVDFETSSRTRYSKCEPGPLRAKIGKKMARNLSGKTDPNRTISVGQTPFAAQVIFRLVRGPLQASRRCAQATLLEPFPATANNNLWCNVGSRSLRSMRSIFQSRQRCLDALSLLTSAAIFVGI